MAKNKIITCLIVMALIAVFTVSAASMWLYPLSDQTIQKNSAVNTVVYQNIKGACRVSTMSIAQPAAHITLKFSGNDMVVETLEQNYVGSVGVTVNCGTEPTSFNLNVVGTQTPATPLPSTWQQPSWNGRRYWTIPLIDMTITKNSADGTVVYPNIKGSCRVPENMDVMPQSDGKFVLEYSGNNLVIKNLEHNFASSRVITAYCNGEPKSFTLHIVNANPVITSTPVTSITVDHLYIYDVEASDSDGDAVWFSLVQAPAGMSIETVSGIISWIPAEAQIGNNAVVVKAFDAFGGETTQTYSILVSDIVRNPPTFISTPSLYGKVSTLYIYDANAEDADYDVLTYSLTTAPAGMTINTNTGVITWTPAANQAGPNDVAVSVTDSRFVTTQRFMISVDSGVAVSIVAEPVSGLAPLTVRFTPVITSGDGPFNLYWDFDGNGVTDLATTQNNALIPHYYFNSYTEGTYNVKLTVTDAQGDSGIATVTIKANPKPEYLPKRIFRVDRITTINEYLSPGEDIEMYINFKNEDNYDLKHVKVTAVISELGVRQTVGPFKLEKGDEVTKRLVLEIPQNVAPGEYNIRTTISNYNGIKRIKYRTVIIN